jgi:hypothetical protein
MKSAVTTGSEGMPTTGRLETSGLACALALRAIYALAAAHERIRSGEQVGRRGWAHLARVLCPAARPVLFLATLCLIAAGALAFVDRTPALMFLLAGCAAVVGFVILARRPAADPP